MSKQVYFRMQLVALRENNTGFSLADTILYNGFDTGQLRYYEVHGTGPIDYDYLEFTVPEMTFVPQDLTLLGTAQTEVTSFTYPIWQVRTVPDDFVIPGGSALPDLRVTMTGLNAATLPENGDIAVNFLLNNAGNAAAGAYRYGLYASSDSVIDPATDTLLFDLDESSLAADTTVGIGLHFNLNYILAPGSYYLGIVVDSSGNVVESNETNNVSAGAPITITANASAAQLFAVTPKLAFLAEFANAAYHLDLAPSHEISAANYNEPSSSGDAWYTQLGTQLRWMTSTDMPTLAGTQTGDPHFPFRGLSAGVYVNGNAAALVGRSSDALFISFRGTNDNSANSSVSGFFGWASPDVNDWFTMAEHYQLYSALVAAIDAYIAVPGNNISKIYVTGHSLGAAMAQRFMQTHYITTPIEAVLFAAPGYSGSWPYTGVDLPDSRITNLWIDQDPILTASSIQANAGDENMIYHPNISVSDGSTHNPELYVAYAQFLTANGIDVAELNSLGGVNFDRIIANPSLYLTDTRNYQIGGFADDITGTADNELMLGGAAPDRLSGLAGVDRLVGGGENDTLIGGGGADTLDGGAGFDTASYAGAAAGITANLLVGIGAGGDAAGDSYISIEALVGSGQGDTLVGLPGFANTLSAGSGDDFLYGEGIDTVDGGAGSDVFFGQQGGALNLNLAAVSLETVWGSVVADNLNGATATANLSLIGQGGADTMRGGSGNDFIYFDNLDSISGGAGTDWAVATLSASGVSLDLGATGFENAWGSTSADNMSASSSTSQVVIVGDTGNDSLTGGSAADFLYGFGDNDTLVGGGGNDNLVGGTGLDVFSFGAGWGVDIVWDWVNGSERFNLQGSGAAAFGALTVTQNFAGSGNAFIVFGANGILVVGGANAIDASDFLF